MNAKIVIEIENEYEVARLLNLIRDGKRILRKQGRTQRGIDGYTFSELDKWESKLSNLTGVKCEWADGEI